MFRKMSRRNIRECIFQIVFRAEFNNSEEMQEQLELACEEFANANTDIPEMVYDNPNVKQLTQGMTEEDLTYIKKKAGSILAMIDELDIILSTVTEGWTIRRVGKAELAILRIAVYEIKYDSDIPYKVAINEAVELSKKYCNPEASSFVNGVLARITED